MKKRGILFTLFLIPLFVFFGSYLNFDNISAILFLLILIVLIIKNKDVLTFQSMLKLGDIPIIYAVLWKTKFGIKFMDKITEKYREIIKLLGYCFIGLGFVGLVYISVIILNMLVNLFITPKETSEGVALLLPLTNIPGLGYLSFWHFLITIFIVAMIHEFAHGIVARAHKIPVKSSGVGIFSIILPLFPLAFVEPNEKKMQKEPDVVQYSIFAAGPVINIMLAILIALFMSSVLVPIEGKITNPIGFSYSDVMDNYSAQEVGMTGGMIINSVNGEEVLTYQEFSSVIGDVKPGDELVLASKNESFTVTAKGSPDDPNKGFIGILGIQNEVRIKSQFDPINKPYFWFKGLLKWLYLINFLIGMINLLPLMVTDGGRMLKLALEKIMKDSKKANKVWAFIGFVFIFTLLSAMVIKYGLSLFSAIS